MSRAVTRQNLLKALKAALHPDSVEEGFAIEDHFDIRQVIDDLNVDIDNAHFWELLPSSERYPDGTETPAEVIGWMVGAPLVIKTPQGALWGLYKKAVRAAGGVHILYERIDEIRLDRTNTVYWAALEDVMVTTHTIGNSNK